jgi:hypothetical protein
VGFPDDQEAATPPSARRLVLAFDDPEAFREEYARNLARGGALVASRDVFDPREVVEILLEAGFAGEKLLLAAEVVHSEGGTVFVQFLDPAPELRQRLEPLLERRRVGSSTPERTATAAPRPEASRSGAKPSASPALDYGDVPFDLEGPELDGATEGAAPEGGLAPGESTDPNERTFRERADREPTRVAVSVRAPNGRPLAGRTRDLSDTGLLVSVEGEELPVGRPVRVDLMHPQSKEVLKVPARVVRHLEGEGVVPAVAIAFEPGARRPDLERFVLALRAADAEQRKGGIRGPLEELGGPSLLQMFSALSREGTLTVSHGVEEGYVAFSGGTLLAARVGAVQGVKAVARILSWRSGFFEFRAHVDAGHAPEDAVPMEGAILEALRMIDEGNRAAAPTLPPGGRFEIVRDLLGAGGEPLGKTEQAVLELAAAGFTVRRILDVIPETDAAVRAALMTLLERGLLRPLET